jgi:hypothetical protein
MKNLDTISSVKFEHKGANYGINKMNRTLPIVLFHISAAFCAAFQTYRISDPVGKANIWEYPNVKAAISSKIPTGTCVVGEMINQNWAEISIIINHQEVSGFVSNLVLTNSRNCDSVLIRSEKCDFMDNKLTKVANFNEFELWRQKYYVYECDDGGFSESISDIVTRNLFQNWTNEILALQSNFLTDATRKIIYSHIDETIDLDRMDLIKKRLLTCKDDARHVCIEIGNRIRLLDIHKTQQMGLINN